jgi:hypothetical protein
MTDDCAPRPPLPRAAPGKFKLDTQADNRTNQNAPFVYFHVFIVSFLVRDPTPTLQKVCAPNYAKTPKSEIPRIPTTTNFVGVVCILGLHYKHNTM